jgi:hypothetical protein
MDRLLTIKNTRDKESDLANSDKTIFEVGGKPFHGIHHAEICFEPGELVVAKLHVWAAFDDIHNVIPKFYMHHPETEDVKEVASITFTDGEKYDF